MRLLLYFLLLSLTSCGALKAFKRHVSGIDEVQVTKKTETKKAPVKRSPNQVAKLEPPPRPQRSPLDSIQSDQMGSLWSEAGQDNFFFSKNIKRRVGDIIILKVGTDVDESLNDKIQSYLAELAEAQRKKEAAKAKAAGTVAPTTTATPMELSEAEKVELGDVTLRLDQQTERGGFSVSGQKQVFVQNKRFGVKISGIVKMEDIGADDTIPSSRLLDSQVSIVK